VKTRKKYPESKYEDIAHEQEMKETLTSISSKRNCKRESLENMKQQR